MKTAKERLLETLANNEPCRGRAATYAWQCWCRECTENILSEQLSDLPISVAQKIIDTIDSLDK